jgi:hypothetical protein
VFVVEVIGADLHQPVGATLRLGAWVLDGADLLGLRIDGGGDGGGAFGRQRRPHVGHAVVLGDDPHVAVLGDGAGTPPASGPGR